MVKVKIVWKREEEIEIGTFGDFNPSWDDTDHFQFVCNKCGKIALTRKVEYVTYPKPKLDPCLHIQLFCPECKRAGQRKIYLGHDSNPAFNHCSVNFYDMVCRHYFRGRNPHKSWNVLLTKVNMMSRKCKSCGKEIEKGFFCSSCHPYIEVFEDYNDGSGEPHIWMDSRKHGVDDVVKGMLKKG